MLSKRFGDDAGLLLDLAAYMIVDEENAGQYYPDFAFCHPLLSEGMRIFSDSKVSRFLNSVTKDQTIGFLDDWDKKRDHKQRVYISYDSFNKNCQAGDVARHYPVSALPLVKIGIRRKIIAFSIFSTHLWKISGNNCTYLGSLSGIG